MDSELSREKEITTESALLKIIEPIAQELAKRTWSVNVDDLTQEAFARLWVKFSTIPENRRQRIGVDVGKQAKNIMRELIRKSQGGRTRTQKSDISVTVFPTQNIEGIIADEETVGDGDVGNMNSVKNVNNTAIHDLATGLGLTKKERSILTMLASGFTKADVEKITGMDHQRIGEMCKKLGQDPRVRRALKGEATWLALIAIAIGAIAMFIGGIYAKHYFNKNHLGRNLMAHTITHSLDLEGVVIVISALLTTCAVAMIAKWRISHRAERQDKKR